MAHFSRRKLLSAAFGGTLVLALAPALAGKAEAYQDKFVLQCTAPTPSMKNSSYPGASKIVLSNNLVRPAGKPLDAPGQVLHLIGRVTDENCTPITNAIIDIWQTNPFGEYRWASRDELLNPEPIFAGNGRAVTDNLGRYQFTTLFPGAYGKNAPHIHMRISHPEFNNIDTTVYFRGDRRNATDPRFQALKETSQALLLADVMYRDPANPQAGLEVTFNITLKGRSKFRSY